MYDSILFTDLDLPERTTEDYEVHPELGDRIERALMLALSQVLFHCICTVFGWFSFINGWQEEEESKEAPARLDAASGSSACMC